MTPTPAQPAFGPRAPVFDDTYTYLSGISTQLDDNGDFTLEVTVAASQIIGIASCPAVYDSDGYRHTQVNVIVPGLMVGMVNAKYHQLLAEWEAVNSAFRYPPGSKPADTEALSTALADLERLGPP